MSIGRLAHYEIQERIGQGGMGLVFKALDTRLERTVAIKVMPALLNRDAERRARFLREARAVARLNHPNVASIYEIAEGKLEGAEIEPLGAEGALDGLYIAMEFVPGEDLEQRLQRGELEQNEALDLALQIAEGLEAAHEAGVVHRDLKPHNIRITPEGRVKILDFGLAKLREEQTVIQPALDVDVHHRTQDGMIVGTVPYMAPEQVEGKAVDLRADLFAFGVVLYQMFAGRLPFPGGDLIEFVKALAKAKPERLSQVNPATSREIESVVHRLIEANPEQRYQDTKTLVADLRAISISPGALVASPGGSLFDPAMPWLYERGKRKWLGLAAAVGVIGLAVLAWWWLISRDGPPPDRVPRPTIVAVMPAQNLTNSPEIETRCAGVRLDLIQRLNSIRGVVVVDPTELEESRNRANPLIASDQPYFSMDLACRTANETLALTAQVTNVSTTAVRLSESFRTPEEMAHQVARAIGSSASSSSHLEADRTNPIDEAAFASYCSGLALLDAAESASDLERAITYLQDAIRQDQEFAQAHAALSNAYWQLFHATGNEDMVDRAEQEADRSLSLAPNLPETRIAKAHALRGRGSYTEAQAELAEVLKINPDSADARFEMAITLRRQGDFDGGLMAINRAIEIRPTYWRYHDLKATLLVEKGEYAQARSAYQQAVNIAPEISRPAINLSTLEIVLGNPRAAIQAVEKMPRPINDPDLANNLATAYFKVEDYDQATRYFRRATELRPKDERVLGNLGDALLVGGNVEEAQAAFEAALEILREKLAIEPGNQLFLSLQPLYLAKTGRCSEAIEAADLALESSGESIDVYRLRARAYATCDETDLALAAINRAIDLGASVEALRQTYELQALMDQIGVIKRTDDGA